MEDIQEDVQKIKLSTDILQSTFDKNENHIHEKFSELDHKCSDISSMTELVKSEIQKEFRKNCRSIDILESRFDKNENSIHEKFSVIDRKLVSEITFLDDKMTKKNEEDIKKLEKRFHNSIESLTQVFHQTISEFERDKLEQLTIIKLLGSTHSSLISS